MQLRPGLSSAANAMGLHGNAPPRCSRAGQLGQIRPAKSPAHNVALRSASKCEVLYLRAERMPAALPACG